jgi:protein-S-isoprenylcysteine O-methyltransferase Ste14
MDRYVLNVAQHWYGMRWFEYFGLVAAFAGLIGLYLTWSQAKSAKEQASSAKDEAENANKTAEAAAAAEILVWEMNLSASG